MKANSSWVIFQSIKALEIKTSMLFSLSFANNTILSSFFFFFLIINLYFLIPAVITQISNHIVELAVPIVKPTKEAKADMETHPVNIEIPISE